MRVVIFGAAGRTGRELIVQAAAAGHEVSCFVHRTPLAEDLLELVANVTRGDVREGDIVGRAVRGQDAVLVALGVTPGRSDRVLSHGIANIIRAMKTTGTRRLIVMTGAGLVEDRRSLPASWRVAAAVPPLRGMFDEKRREEQRVQASGLGWVIVRPTNLTDGPATGVALRAGLRLELAAASTVSRADVAAFMLDQLQSSQWVRQAVLIDGPLPTTER